MTTIRPACIEFWAARTPDAIALIEGERRLTWIELDTLANRFAHGLAGRGVGPGTVVALRTHVRIEWLVTASALSRLGCRMAGLNWRLTPHETAFVLGNSGAEVLVCDDADLSDVQAAIVERPLRLAVSIDAEAPGFVRWEDLLSADTSPLYSTAEPPLLIFTSGTTGSPKGVAVHQGNRDAAIVREYRESMEQATAVADGDIPGVQLVAMPMHHASGPSQMWGAVRKGRTLVLMRRFEPEAALALIERHRVTMFGTVPTMFKRIAALPAEVLARYDIGSIRRLTIGAAPVPFALKEWIIGHFGDHCLQENYGSTETGMLTALPPEMQLAKPGSSGRPFRHVTIEVRDTDGHPMPVGEPGELWVDTPTTIRGYLDAQPLGADTLDERGFFRVGDCGYVDPDGYLFLTDRAKDMIISGGVNIYPAEIEAALQTHPAVIDAAVFGIPDDEFGERVMACVQPKEGATVTAPELHEHCANRLASYKRPRRIEIVQDLPRNTMGKVLKRELREPHWLGRDRRI